MSDSVDDLADAVPVPPRYRWLKRFCKLGGFLLVGLLLLRWWWGWEAHRRLQAEIDRIQAAEDPIFPEDLNPTEVIADQDNAALALIEACYLYDTTYELKEFPAPVVMTDEDWGLIAQGIADNAEALALVRSARTRMKSDWGVRFRSPAISTLIPYLHPQRGLAKMLARFSAYYHHIGDDATAVELLRDALHQSELVQEPPMLISYLVGAGSSAKAARTIEFMAHDLAVGDLPGASREQIRSLIGDLLDEDTPRRELQRAMCGERIFQLDSVQQVADGKIDRAALGGMGGGGSSLGSRVFSLLFGPLVELDGERMLQHMRRMIAACGRPNWPAASEIVDVLEIEAGQARVGLERIRRPISALMLPSLASAVRLHYAGLAVRRMAAIALAIRLYELDHGCRPRELSELVPEYLPAVPFDPMAADGRPITFLPNARQPILYSIGHNGKDDGGAYVLNAKGVVQPEESDLVFFLDGQRPQAK